MTQAQAAVNPSLLDRIQAYLGKRYVASIYGPCIFFLFTLAYLYAAVAVSRWSEFWMDEALAASTAQLPNWRAILDAVWHGAELEPPTYYLFLHEILAFTGFMPIQLAARLPSILAGFGAAVVIFVIMRHRVGVVISLLSFGMTLSMGLFAFATQVRRYSFLTFFLALALLFWDRMEDSKRPARRYSPQCNITAVGLGRGDAFKASFPQVQYRQVVANDALPFGDGSFDIVTSNAVLEHVGSLENQRFFVSELLRVGGCVFVTVPHRFFPIEHHTAIPFLHWFDSSFTLACRLFGKEKWASPENLILLSQQKLRDAYLAQMAAEIGRTGIMLGPWSSNLYLFAPSPKSRDH